MFEMWSDGCKMYSNGTNRSTRAHRMNYRSPYDPHYSGFMGPRKGRFSALATFENFDNSSFWNSQFKGSDSVIYLETFINDNSGQLN